MTNIEYNIRQNVIKLLKFQVIIDHRLVVGNAKMVAITDMKRRARS